jgi:hypothetical protein
MAFWKFALTAYLGHYQHTALYCRPCQWWSVSGLMFPRRLIKQLNRTAALQADQAGTGRGRSRKSLAHCQPAGSTRALPWGSSGTGPL